MSERYCHWDRRKFVMVEEEGFNVGDLRKRFKIGNFEGLEAGK